MTDLFLELLQVSIGNRDFLSRIPTELEWRSLLYESQRQAVAGIVFLGLDKMQHNQRPPQTILVQWIGISLQIENIGRLHRQRAQELTEIFKASGYDTSILKGIGVSLLYPEPLRRQCGDIDIWTSGRRKDVMTWLRSLLRVGEVRWHHVNAPFFMDVQTEIHFHATWLFNPFRNKKLQKWLWDNGFPFNKDTRYGFKVPSVAFNAVYSLVHSFHHLLESGIGFRHVVDYYYILVNLQVESHDDVVTTIKSIGLYRFLGAMMFVLKEACGAAPGLLLCEPNNEEGIFLLNEIKAAGNFGHKRHGRALPQNSIIRFWTMVRHYPVEVLWMFPWKVWHLGWRLLNR